MYHITYSDKFLKGYKRLTDTEKKQLRKKVEILVENPLHPSLRTKRIQGTADLFECSVNMDMRLIWAYQGETVILFLDVGHHDILKKY